MLSVRVLLSAKERRMALVSVQLLQASVLPRVPWHGACEGQITWRAASAAGAPSLAAAAAAGGGVRRLRQPVAGGAAAMAA